jgi:hypothetical protein
LWDVYFADSLHALFALFLLVEEFALSADVAAVALVNSDRSKSQPRASTRRGANMLAPAKRSGPRLLLDSTFTARLKLCLPKAVHYLRMAGVSSANLGTRFDVHRRIRRTLFPSPKRCFAHHTR